MARPRAKGSLDDELVTEVDDELYRNLLNLTGQQIVHAVVWEDSMLDAFDDPTASPETRSVFDIDIYLADGVFFELYGTLCYQQVDGEPLHGLDDVTLALATMLKMGLWLDDVAVDDSDSLALIVSSHQRSLILAVCGWSLAEWSDLPERS